MTGRKRVRSAGNETTSKSSVGAKGESKEPSPWEQESAEDDETLTLSFPVHCLENHYASHHVRQLYQISGGYRGPM